MLWWTLSQLPTHLPNCLYRPTVSFRRYRGPRPLKLPLSCEVVEKMWFWPPFVGGILHISDMHFQITLTSEHVAGLVQFRSASSKGSGRKGRRIAVKPKSADRYVGRPNNHAGGESCESVSRCIVSRRQVRYGSDCFHFDPAAKQVRLAQFLVCYHGSLVSLCVCNRYGYKSSYAAATICATLVNIQTQTDSILASLYEQLSRAETFGAVD